MPRHLPGRLAVLALTLPALGAGRAAVAQTSPAPASTQAAPAGKSDAAATADTAATDAATDAATVPRVQVNGSASHDDARRDDTASKTVINQEELRKYGDTNVFDVLKRAPGVTVTGTTIRMRGLGAGYTQVLVNGERAPPGLSLDDLPPDQIERIEIMRAASAEFSMQAIAGTINIVLRKVAAKAQRDLRVNAGLARDMRSELVSGTLADRAGRLAYFVTATVTHNRNDPASSGGDRFTTPDGELTQLRTSRSARVNESTGVILQPRLNWKLANDDQLNASGFAQGIHATSGTGTLFENRIGSFGEPDYTQRRADGDNRIRYAGVDLNWVAKLGGGKLDAKVSVNLGRVSSRSAARYATVSGAAGLLRDADSQNRYTTYTSSGKYARSLAPSNSLAMGWEASRRQSEEHAVRLDRFDGALPLRVDETFTPHVTRVALFAQDEWNVTDAWSMYLGARWESIGQASGGIDDADSAGARSSARSSARNSARSSARSDVFGPVAQTLYKFPDKSGRQVRLALTRTFKAPELGQISARRVPSPLNTRFAPDSSGNPDLQPELATGVDATYEHFWAPGALLSVSASLRRISGIIRTTLVQDADGLWLSRPGNDGAARVRTLEVELKMPLKLAWAAAPPIELRASVDRNWSSVAAVPGPDNRLDDQVPLSATAGVDYRRDKLSVGASLAYRASAPVRLSARQSSVLVGRRDLDAYLLYKFSAQRQLRVALANQLRDPYRNLARYQDNAGLSETWSASPARTRLQVTLELHR